MLYLIPKNALSRLVGKLVYIQWPSPIKEALILAFGKYYKINFSEAEKPYSEYDSIGDFFVRRLKLGARSLAGSPLVHPADARISQVGKINQDQLIQAKGKTYDLIGFTKDDRALDKWGNGFFLTYYLCPTDYHRVHSPISGKIIKAAHIPGQLWPVNEWSTNHINDLFVVNERVVVEIESKQFGLIGVVFVGATNVGDMAMAFDREIVTNQRGKNQASGKSYDIEIQKGDELGMFKMGSTVVLLLPKTFDYNQLQKHFNQNVKMGEPLI